MTPAHQVESGRYVLVLHEGDLLLADAFSPVQVPPIAIARWAGGEGLSGAMQADTKRRHAREKPIADLRTRVVKELERLAFSDARDLVQWSREPVRDQEGNIVGFEDVLVATPSHILKRDAAATIKSVTTKSGNLKLDIHDKLAALDKLGRMLGLFHDPAPAANVTVNQLNLNDGPETAREAIKRLAFAIAKVQHAAIAAPQPAMIEKEKAETVSAKKAIN
jgi:hypothetical protein